MKTRFVAAASLLAVCISAASTGAGAQPSGAQGRQQLREQLADYRDERTAVNARIAEVEARIAGLRTAQKPGRLNAAWTERAQLRAELRALDASIRVLAMLYKNGGEAGSTSLQRVQTTLERKVADSTVALRLAREELESARTGNSELSVEQATQAMQLAARQYRSALLTAEAFKSNREEIDEAVTVVQSASQPAGLPKKGSTDSGSTTTESPGKSRKPGAVIDDPVASTEPVVQSSVIDTMETIASGGDATEPTPEPAPTSEPVAVVEPAVEPSPEPTAAPEPTAVIEPEPTVIAQAEPAPIVEPEPEVVAEAEPAPVIEPEPEVIAETEPAPVIEPEPEQVAATEPEPVPPAEAEPEAEPVAVIEPEPVAEPDPEPIAATEPEPAPVLPEEPVISEEEVDDLLAAAPPPSPAPVAEPEQPAPVVEEPIAVLDPTPAEPEPEQPPADDPVAVSEPEPVVQEPEPALPPPVDEPVVAIEEPAPAPQPEEPAPVVVSGVATLSWSTPMTRANGAPLSMAELSGYEIYVIAESTGESSVIAVNDPTAMSYTVENLRPDTYHFAISAVDTDKHVSDMSPIVSKTIADTTVASAP